MPTTLNKSVLRKKISIRTVDNRFNSRRNRDVVMQDEPDDILKCIEYTNKDIMANKTEPEEKEHNIWQIIAVTGVIGIALAGVIYNKLSVHNNNDNDNDNQMMPQMNARSRLSKNETEKYNTGTVMDNHANNANIMEKYAIIKQGIISAGNMIHGALDNDGIRETIESCGINVTPIHTALKVAKTFGILNIQ
jgi:hypothetical protein